MQIYELGYLILPSISEGQFDDVVAKLKTLVAQTGGQVIDSEDPFKHPLAYTMSKTIGASGYLVKEAYIGWMKFELEPSQAPNLKVAVDKLDEVLRSLLIKAPRETTFTFAKAKALLAEKARLEAVPESAEVETVKETVLE